MSYSKTKIAIVDDHALLRQGIQSLLQGLDDVEVIATASSGEEAVTLLTTHSPDIFLMDIMMKGMSGIETTRWIKEQSPTTRVILISSEVNKEYIAAGIKAGINGYLPKDSSREALVDSIHTVMKGERYFSPEVTALVFQDFYLKEKDGKGLPRQKTKVLSKREEEVLAHIASGKSLKETADELFISVKTVETHKQHIQDKLGLKNTALLVKYAIDHKLI
ncbi:MAG: DNA-binding response regulator [Azospira oryzae]|jgi:DNA-binding NarL/FixJ family response regulator|nr:MAG: DNA-binding response regulator [Azospira oryzae]